MSRTTANALLLLTAVIWGTAFVPQYTGMEHVGPFAFTGIRFFLGGLCITPLVWREYVRLKENGITLDRRDVSSWLGVGLLLTGGALMQQIGIPDTTVTNAGFITALYVPLVPILVWFLHGERPASYVWLANAGSIFGVFLLSGASLSTLRLGDLWIFVGSLFWAMHVVVVGRVAIRKNTPGLLALVQFMTCGLLASVLAIFLEPETTAQGVKSAMPAILYGGVLSVGIGFTLQVIAQAYTHASDAALILSSEFLIAALAGAIWLNERLNLTQMTGATIIFLCIIMVQCIPFFKRTTLDCTD